MTLLDGYIVDLEQYSGLFNDTKSYDLSPSHIGEFALSGPIWGNRLTFSFASQLRRDESYLPNDDGLGYTLQGKMKFEVMPGLKLTASGAFRSARNPLLWRKRPILAPPQFQSGIEDSRSLSAQLSHNINSATFYTLTFGQFHRSLEANQPGKVWDPLNKTFDENAWDPEKSLNRTKRKAESETRSNRHITIRLTSLQETTTVGRRVRQPHLS